MDIDVSEIRQYVEGTIDFEGQKLAKKRIDKVLLVGSVLSIIATLVLDKFEVLVGGLAGSYIASLLFCLPWGMYRKNAVSWASA